MRNRYPYNALMFIIILLCSCGSGRSFFTNYYLKNEKTLTVIEQSYKALYQQRLLAAGNMRRVRAINRAALNIEASPWWWNEDEAELTIISASDLTRRYRITPMGCDCQAARASRPCWHAEAYRLISSAYAMGKPVAAVAPRPRRSFEELSAAADSLFN